MSVYAYRRPGIDVVLNLYICIEVDYFRVNVDYKS